MDRSPPSPHRYIAFLRAINVGGHIVKMDRLRSLFEALGFSNVATFIASGNVIFDVPGVDARAANAQAPDAPDALAPDALAPDALAPDAQALERRIERALREALGYVVATFLRTPAELAAVARHRAFPSVDVAAEAHALYIGFLPAPPAPAAAEALLRLRTDADDLHVHGRELYWLCRTRMGESPLTGARLEKALGMPATLRNATTVERLVAKYAASSGES
jgi:uncharacterized protein (DUF1697 family)